MTPLPSRDRDRGRRRRRRDRALAWLLLAAAAAAVTGLALSRSLLPRTAAAAPTAHHQAQHPQASTAPARATGHTERDTAALEQAVEGLVAATGGQAGVYFQELSGPRPARWGLDADVRFTAASTYKLPLLMAESRRPAAELLCYLPEDWQDGPFGDYVEGACYARSALMERVGKQSDNTSAHILLRDIGGRLALDAYARTNGAANSSFVDPNLTTAADLGRLLARASPSLYPLLTDTENQTGLPAGVPPGVQVAHKDGWYEDAESDAGIVLVSPRGPYALVVCTQGIGGEAGWALIAAISRAVWAFEAGLPA